MVAMATMLALFAQIRHHNRQETRPHTACESGRRLHRQIVVLARRLLDLLSPQHRQRAAAKQLPHPIFCNRNLIRLPLSTLKGRLECYRLSVFAEANLRQGANRWVARVKVVKAGSFLPSGEA